MKSRIAGIIFFVFSAAVFGGMTVNYGDKGISFSASIKELAALLKDGKKVEAIKAADDLIAKFEDEVKKNAGKDKEKTPSPEAIEADRCYLHLVKANVLCVTGRMTKSNWLDFYSNRLAKVSQPQKVMNKIAELPEELMRMDMAMSLMRSDLPIDNKSRKKLAGKAIDLAAFAKMKPQALWDDFYYKLSESPTVEDKSFVIGKYSYILQKNKQGNKIDDALWNIIRLSGNDELKIAACEILVSRCRDQKQANAKILEIHSRVQSEKVRQHFFEHWLIALAATGKTSDAMTAYRGTIDTDTEKQPADTKTCLYKLEQLNPPKPSYCIDYWLDQKPVEIKTPSAAVMFANLAEEYIAEKKYDQACDMAFSSMSEIGRYPMDLETAKPINSLDEICSQMKCEKNKPLAEYLTAFAFDNLGYPNKIELHLDAMGKSSQSLPLNCHANLLRAKMLKNNKKQLEAYELIRNVANKADSPVLRTYIEVYTPEILGK